MDNFTLNTTIRATVSGLAYSQKYNESTKSFEEDTTSFQIQTLVAKENGELVKKTLKVNKSLDLEQLKIMINKTFEFTEIEEYSHKNGDFTTYTYSAKNFKQIESKETIFEVNKTIKMKVLTISEDNRNDEINSKLQTTVIDGLRADLKTVKIKGIAKADLINLQNKPVLISNVRVSKMNGKTYYSTDTKPKAL